MLKTLGAEELGVILRKSPRTIKEDARRSPERIPPSIKIPGGKLLRMEKDVEYCILCHQQKKTKRRP